MWSAECPPVTNPGRARTTRTVSRGPGTIPHYSKKGTSLAVTVPAKEDVPRPGPSVAHRGVDSSVMSRLPRVGRPTMGADESGGCVFLWPGHSSDRPTTKEVLTVRDVCPIDARSTALVSTPDMPVVANDPMLAAMRSDATVGIPVVVLPGAVRLWRRLSFVL